MTVFATKLKMADYATYEVGKWHVGMASTTNIPTGRGFDTSFRYLNAACANDYYNETDNGKHDQTEVVDMWNTSKPASDKNGTGYEEALFRERLLYIIAKIDASKPFFLYYATHIVHKPYKVPKEYLDMFKFIMGSR